MGVKVISLEGMVPSTVLEETGGVPYEVFEEDPKRRWMTYDSPKEYTERRGMGPGGEVALRGEEWGYEERGRINEGVNVLVDLRGFIFHDMCK